LFVFIFVKQQKIKKCKYPNHICAKRRAKLIASFEKQSIDLIKSKMMASIRSKDNIQNNRCFVNVSSTRKN